MSKRKGLLYDSTLCLGGDGCGAACYHACKEQNKLPGDLGDNFLNDRLSSNTYTVIEKYGDKPTRKLCMHCIDPTCVSVCPVGAFEKTELGPVLYDENKCIGCRYCMQACPHSIPRYEWSSNNPRVRKCIMCHERVEQGQPTACAENCPTGATTFGDYDELITEAKKRITENPGSYHNEIYGLQDAGGSNVLVIAGVPLDKLGFIPNLPKESLPNLTHRALEKIPTIVSGGAVFLGGMYWLTKRKNQIAKEELNGKGGK
jgi:formate dehydrogenase iron-sulfur subunit